MSAGLGLFGDVITVYTALGEDAGGKMGWLRTVVRHVSVFRYGGAKQYPARTLEGDDRLAVYCHFLHMRAERPYADEAAFSALADKTAAWTVRTDGADRLFLGVCGDMEPSPGPNLCRPLVVVANNKGRDAMRHIKILCK